jgi:hypothetical protein
MCISIFLEAHEISSSICQKHFQQQIKLACAFYCTTFQGGCDFLLWAVSSTKIVRDAHYFLIEKEKNLLNLYLH